MTETLADAVTAIAADAGRVAMARFGTDFKRWEKSPGNPVCEVDLELDAMLRERLGALLPEAGWLSEETVDNADRLGATKAWVVDPIDGTRDYLRGRKGWAVSIALVEHGRPVIGILEAPARGERWRAEAGKGAYRNADRLRVHDRAELVGARVPANDLAKADRLFERVHQPNSIALRMAMVAAGEADLVATVRWGHEWDIAAATLLASEAGAVVSDATGAPIGFNSPRGDAYGVLVAAPGIHAAAVEHVRERAAAGMKR